jgi:8-oxo-dGTP pyrophosphatase MutT (NUDIX family)
LSLFPGLTAKLAARAPPERASDPACTGAAVAALLAAEPESVLLIRRAERAGDRWSGQLAFPGGRSSPGDADLAATARRETLEEVGIDLAGAALLGMLDDLAPRTPVLPPMLVRPFVFALPRSVPLSLNHEVAEARWVPLATLRQPGVYGPTEFRRYGTLVRTYGYRLELGVLWGMTERILTPLLELTR